MPRYRWDSPHDWLEDAILDRKISATEALAALMEFIDPDEIQDVFQAEMERDGYFGDLNDECSYCGHTRGSHDKYGCVGDADCHCGWFESI